MNICGITQKERGNVLNIKITFYRLFPSYNPPFFWGFSIATFDYRRVVDMESNMEI